MRLASRIGYFFAMASTAPVALCHGSQSFVGRSPPARARVATLGIVASSDDPKGGDADFDFVASTCKTLPPTEQVRRGASQT